ncbi:MAG: hypothetical protein Crog4KO_29670 [Crocinitomicaceae bacterium]
MKKLLSLSFTIFLFSYSYAQINYAGTDFWINSCDENSSVADFNVIRIFGDVATLGNVSIPGTGFSQDFCFNSGGAFIDIELPYGLYGMTLTNTVQNNAIHITTDNNVMVIFFPISGADSDYYIAIPSMSTGTEYFINTPKGVGFWNPAYTQVTATENNTNVTITNPDSELGPYVWGVGNSIATGSSTVFILNTGESVRFEAGRDDSTGPASNLQHSGTRILSDKPVFVSSKMSTVIPASFSYSYTDGIRESLLPKAVWGNRHFTTEWEPGIEYLIQVVSADNGNIISLNGSAVALLNASEMFDTIISSPQEITSTFDVSVVQSSLSKTYTSVSAGDPSSFNLLSESNFNTTFHDINAGYVNSGTIDSVIYMLTVPTSAIPGTTLNGTLISPALYSPILGTSYSNAIIEMVTPASGSEFMTFNSTQPIMVYKTGLSRMGGVSAEWQVSRNLGTLNNVPNSNVYDSTCAMTMLPLDYVEFTGREKGDYNELTWSTQSELNNDHFEVERSFNGVDFEPIGRVDGVGTTTLVSEYHFFDKNPIKGVQYYRLKQVDVDGTYSRSKIISIKQSTSEQISFYPNPAVSTITISDLSDSFRVVDIYLYSIAGKLLLKKEAMDLSSPVTLEVSSLQVGTYYLELNNSGKIIRKRFVKK